MKKRLFALLFAFMLFVHPAMLVYAENSESESLLPSADDFRDKNRVGLSESGEVGTGTQEGVRENEIDVDEDIKDEVNAQIPLEIEEITISSTEDFLKFAENCRLDTWSVNKKVSLNSDISLIGTEFTRIPQFGGFFDGGGHTISGLNIGTGISNCGLFSNIQKSGVVINLNVKGTIIPSGEQVMVGGICAENSGVISKCSYTGVISGNDYVGGIAGINQLSGVIDDCSCTGYIHGVHFTGGICGENIGNITDCVNNASVNTTNTDTKITIDAMSTLNKVISLVKNIDGTSTEANSDVTVSDAGGISGLSIGIISRCVNTGDVGYEHVGYNIGGIAGRQSGFVYKCTNSGLILGRKDVGGIVGQAEPYITVDLSTDVAYQLSEAIGKLHDIVTKTLNETKNQSNVISGRLSVIQNFTSGALNDVKYIANGTIDYANGISGATSEAFSRVEYVLDETTKQGGVLDHTESAAGYGSDTAKELKEAADNLDVDKYLTGDEKQQYEEASSLLETGSVQYGELYDRAYRPFYNYYVYNGAGGIDGVKNRITSKKVDFIRSDGSAETDYTGWELSYSNSDFTGVHDGSSEHPNGGTPDEKTIFSYILNKQKFAQDGSYKYSDGTSFPNTSDATDTALSEAARNAAKLAAEKYARYYWQNPNPGMESHIGYYNSGANNYISYYDDDMTAARDVVTTVITKHRQDILVAFDNAGEDAAVAMNSFEKAMDELKTAGSGTKDILKNIAGRDNISFPQFSDEYKARTTSFVSNMQGMNDNFGLLNTEMNNATGVIVDDLQEMSDQFNVIMNLFADAVDGVLEKDYTQNFEDVSFDEARECTDATIDMCVNYGQVEGDIDTAGIAGTMAIEYDYDMESDITGIKDSKLNTSYITKCVIRNSENYNSITSEKNYVGGICGLQEMGTVIGCANMGNPKSSSGEYAGGVCGRSLSYVTESTSSGILDGTSYIGGICGDGMHISDCMSLVKICNATSYFGAIAGHVSDEGVVRNNTFISDELAGVDIKSFASKAYPVEYDARSVPYDFKSLTISFVLKDDELDKGKKIIKKANKKYGDSLEFSEYPRVDEREGYYVDWDIENIDEITNDEIVTARYVKYKTTIGEVFTSGQDDLYQGEILVDGSFKADDKLEVDRKANYTVDTISERIESLSQFSDYETITVKVPEDGNKVHRIRFKPELGPHVLFPEYSLYLVDENGNKVDLASIGEKGKYRLYEVEGDDFTIGVRFESTKKRIYMFIGLVIGIILAVIIVIIIVIVVLSRKKNKISDAINVIANKVTEKIESKEQLFYDDSKEENNVKKNEDKENNDMNSSDNTETDADENK
ncbi:hypothetical protein [Butyrivibrio sp. INlla14]|uniref:hypothetical protein n=1 Tax=Butyrivibrio sp. INlla14 TaxID=1520808 RepID=UPI000876D43B|nr:hypothetical protein [Butyrivibrio sp. INlla14]SCY70677.1 hypothetical protein SAMN02910371_03496 [Butyrivibrio sp. INlla14]